MSHNAKRGILSHWLWALPILLIVAALALRQINLYPPTGDEFFSMNDAGWLINGPYSPIEILQSLQQYSSNHTPGFFMLLSVWGNLIAYDIALARIFTIFIGLLALAMTYRLARDFVAPVAALFALIIIASNTFYNFYYAHARMYTLLLLTSAIALWLYLRIIYQQKQVKKTDYAALGAAVFALISTHAFSAAFLLMLGIYHLLIAPKNRRWWQISATVLIALLLFSPWMAVLATAGIDQALADWGDRSVGSITAVRTWLEVTLNNQPFLLILSGVGLAVGMWTKKMKPQPYLILFVPFLTALAIFAHFTDFVAMSSMRYQLASWPLFVLFIAAGLYGLYRFRKYLGLLTLLWIIAGLAFQQTADWNQYLAGYADDFSRPPWQVISRLALQAAQKPIIIAHQHQPRILNWRYIINYSQREHYFDRHDLTLETANNLKNFEDDIRQHAITEPSTWVSYQTSKTNAAEAAEIESIIHDLNYQLCDTIEIGINTVIRQYAWKTLDCQPPQLQANHQTATLDYQFYGAALHAADSKLYFSDQWAARTDADLSSLQMSYQLISADWNKAAQLDLPLVHEGQPRLFSIDIANVPTGHYRLMAILYDKRTGQRQNWLNSEEDPPDMLTLTEIIIP